MDTFILLLLSACVGHAQARGGHSGEYCNTETFRAECSEGSVIVMQSALYGRMKLGRCVQVDVGYLNCHEDVLQIADRKCSGKRVCEIRVPDAEFENTKPCFGELKSYLEANFTCIPVAMTTREHCEEHDQMNITQSSGNLSSTVTSDIIECSGSTHPWVIYAQPWQRVNLTLRDFSVQDRDSVSYVVPGDDTPTRQCFDYGIIEDSGTDEEITICGGQKRISHVYTSLGHVVKVWVTNDMRGKNYRRFLIEFSVIGCPDPVLPDYGVFERTTSGGRVICLHDNNSWELRCHGTTWVGSYGNCSQPTVNKVPRAEERDESSVGDEEDEEEELSMSIGITIAIVVGAVFGLALVLIIFCFVRYRRLHGLDATLFGCRHQHRESILMRQKAAAAAAASADNLKHCSPTHQLTAAGPGPETARLTEEIPQQTKMGNGSGVGGDGGGSLSANSTPSMCHHHHAVKVDGNDYEHIWEAPTFTLARGTTIKADITCSVHAKHQREPSYTTFKMDNQLKETKPSQKPHHITGMDLFPGRAKIVDAPVDNCRYSTLPNRTHAKTNGCAPHQDLLL